MLNQVILVGRLCSTPTVQETEEGKKVCNIKVAVPRPFKNGEGEYETDFIDVVLWSSVAENTAEYCRKGDLVGIKGRLQTHNKKMEVIAEKITFLSSKKQSEDE